MKILTDGTITRLIKYQQTLKAEAELRNNTLVASLTELTIRALEDYKLLPVKRA